MVNCLKFCTEKRILRLANNGAAFSLWYEKAFDEISIVCGLEGWDVSQFTARLAILSPRVSIRRNCRAAFLFQSAGVFFDNTPKSVRQSLLSYEKTGSFSKRARKVESFNRALLGDQSAIVLDTWVAKALKVDQRSFGSQRGYNAACGIICKLSKRIGIPPRNFQAALWAGVFSESALNRKPNFLPIVEEYNRFLKFDRSFPLSGSIG